MNRGDEMWTENRFGERFTDAEVATYVIKHLRIRDLLRPKSIIQAALLAYDVFLKEAEIVSEKKNWKFFDKNTEFKWL